MTTRRALRAAERDAERFRCRCCMDFHLETYADLCGACFYTCFERGRCDAH